MLHFPGATFLKLECSQSRLQLLSKQRYLDVGLTTSDSVGLPWNLMIVLSNKFSADCCWWWSWAALWKRLTWKKKEKVMWWEGSLKGILPRLQWPHCRCPWKSYLLLTSSLARHLGTSSWRKMQMFLGKEHFCSFPRFRLQDLYLDPCSGDSSWLFSKENCLTSINASFLQNSRRRNNYYSDFSKEKNDVNWFGQGHTMNSW